METTAGRLKVSLDYWAATLTTRENLAALKEAAQEGGMLVPDTPVYASSPGIVLLQRQKKLEMAEAVCALSECAHVWCAPVTQCARSYV